MSIPVTLVVLSEESSEFYGVHLFSEFTPEAIALEHNLTAVDVETSSDHIISFITGGGSLLMYICNEPPHRKDGTMQYYGLNYE
jgi:hypothetical protein